MLGNQRRYRGEGKGYGIAWNEELFREELGRRADVNFYGWGYDPEWTGYETVPEIVERFGKPDAIVIHYDLPNYVGFNDVDALKVWVSGDFYEGAFRWKKYLRHVDYCNYDISCGYASLVVNCLKKYNVGERQYLLPFGVDTYLHRNLRVQKEIDVAAIYTRGKERVYPMRKVIHRFLQEMERDHGISIELNRYFFDEYVLKLNQSRISVNSNARFKFVQPRVLETLACGTFLLTDRNSDFEKLGYIDGYHLVLYEGIDDLKEKIFYYLENEEEREEIAENGRRFVRERYTLGHRAEGLISVVGENL